MYLQITKMQNTMKSYEAWLKLYDKSWPKQRRTEGFHPDQVASRSANAWTVHLGKQERELKHS